MKVTCFEEGNFPNVFVSYLIRPCYHCTNPPCREVCPVEAITKRKRDGIVVVDRDACIGKTDCGACVDACPYGAPQFDNDEDAKMQKCDLCLERWQEGKSPICVESCPLRALDAGPLEELKAKYGERYEATGFVYDTEAKPSIIMKSKINPYKQDTWS
jgi:anaerobic dimethyl sulfoxide reductase subunit B (iron-sulfur subunit)